MARRATAAGIDLQAKVFATSGRCIPRCHGDDLGTPSAVAVIFDGLRQANAALDDNDLGAAQALSATVVELAGVLD